MFGSAAKAMFEAHKASTNSIAEMCLADILTSSENQIKVQLGVDTRLTHLLHGGQMALTYLGHWPIITFLFLIARKKFLALDEAGNIIFGGNSRKGVVNCGSWELWRWCGSNGIDSGVKEGGGAL